jgi:hypothetical protein
MIFGPNVCLTFVPKTGKERKNHGLLAHPRQFLTGLLFHFHMGSGGHGERLVKTLVLKLSIGY